MFKCDTCGLVNNGIKQHKIPIAVREVIYALQVRSDRSYRDGTNTEPTYRTIKEVKGSEVVKEGTFCDKHIPEEDPKIVESVVKTQIVKSKRRGMEE